NHLTRSRRATWPPKTVKKADDRKDRTTAFTAFADLPLDADDDALHRPSRHRPRAVLRHAAARLVADRSRLGPDRLCPCAILHLEHHRPVDRLRLHLGAAASPAQRHPPLRLGPRLWLQGQ